MKKIFLLLTVCSIGLLSCTEQTRAKKWGGSANVNLPAGKKLIIATWKDSDLWYLTEDMDSSYIPKVKTFQESSSWGIYEGTITFNESR